MQGTNESSLEYLAGEDWFPAKRRNNSILVRFYLAPACTEGNTSLPVKPGEDIPFDGTPFRIMMGQVADKPYTSVYAHVVEATKDAKILFEEIKRILPTASYTIVSCPIKNSDAESYEASAMLMDQLIGALRPVVGNAVFHSLASEVAVTLSDKNMRQLLPATRLPQACAGPFAERNNWQETQEILSPLTALQGGNNLKKTLKLALELFEKAARENAPSNFFLYWVAIEVAAGEAGRNIKRILSECYQESFGFVQNTLGFEKILNLRNDSFHHGDFHDMPQDVERYIQVLFLDILRHRLGLSNKRHTQNYISDGFDLTRLDPLVGKSNVPAIRIT